MAGYSIRPEVKAILARMPEYKPPAPLTGDYIYSHPCNKLAGEYDVKDWQNYVENAPDFKNAEELEYINFELRDRRIEAACEHIKARLKKLREAEKVKQAIAAEIAARSATPRLKLFQPVTEPIYFWE